MGGEIYVKWIFDLRAEAFFTSEHNCLSQFGGGIPIVLVAEDSEDTRHVLSMELRHSGCRVVTAADGREAVETALLARPDLILMDLHMPRLDGLAAWLAGLSTTTGPFVVVVCFFLISVLVSELMSNSGTVALLGPVTVAVAAKMNVNPMALLAAITFGSSAAFAMPIGYQTSLMIYGPGGYRFRDFLRMGIPLDLLLALLALWLIPIFWPLTP